MQDSADSPSRRPRELGRISTVLVVVFGLSVLAFWYGVAVFIGLLPKGWGPVAMLQYALLVLGALLSSLLALVVGQQWRRRQSQPLGGRRAVLLSLIASAFPLGAVILVERLRRGEFALPQLFGWTLFGVLILSLQFALGAANSGQQPRRTFLAECTLVFGGTFTYLTITPVEPHLVGNLLVAGVACILLLGFGGPLYLLGTHLSRAPQ